MTLYRLILVSFISIVMTAVPLLQADTVGTAFTYQGVLSDAGAPVAGDYDFRVFLYNADVGGSQVGSTVLVGGVTVIDGRVALDLDFGDVFDGTALWLEIHLRETGTTTYASLLPRQRLTATPFANHAAEAVNAASALWADDSGSAVSAADADQLGGQSPAYYLEWSNITGVPADLSNGDDDTLADLSCAAGEIAKWSGSTWACGDDAGILSSTFVVGPLGGNAAENGLALLAALADIPTPTGPLYAALLKIEPGYYDLDGSGLAMKPWVDIEGSGPGVTRVFSDRCNTSNTNSEVIRLAEGAELRDLAVANFCSLSPDGNAVGIYNTAAGAVIRNVRVFVKDGAERAWGVHNNGGTDFAVVDSEIWVGCDDAGCEGIRFSSGPTSIRRTQILVNGGSSALANGIYCYTDAVVNLSDLSVEVVDGGEFNTTGVLVRGGAILTMRDVTAKARRMGIFVQNPHASLRNVTATGDFAVSIRTGSSNGAEDTFSALLEDVGMTGGLVALEVLENSGDLSATVRHSQLQASSHALWNIGSNVDVGGSHLSPGPVETSSGGTTRCAANWDGTFAFHADTCP